MANRKSLLRRQIQVLVRSGQWINVGIADKYTGGDLKVEGGEDYPRGDGTTVPMGGDQSREDATATFLQDAYFWSIQPELEEVAGEPNNVRVVCTPLNGRRTPLVGGRTYTLTGGLMGVGEPEGGGGENGAAEVPLMLSLNTKKIWS